MIRHVVLLRWKDGTKTHTVSEVARRLGELPAQIPQLGAYRFGSDLGLNEGNHDFAITADFADVADYLTYRDHPAHRAVIAEQIAPNIVERVAVQLMIEAQ